MDKNRNKIIIVAILLFIATIIPYLINFLCYPLYPSVNDWASFGDYIGGIMNPILSFILIYILIKESVDANEQYVESKKLNLKTQELIKEQVELLKVKPDVIYYLFAKQSTVYIAVENIGTATAYDITINFQFTSSTIMDKIRNKFKKLEKINYIPPKYKISFWVAHLLENGGVAGISSHSVRIQYYSEKNGTKMIEQNYYIDDNMLSSLHKDIDYSEFLKDIANNLKRPNTRI